MSVKTVRSLLSKQCIRHYTVSILPESHEILREACRNFAETELKPIASKLDKEQLFPYKQIQKLGKLGVMGVLVPQEYGGSGQDSLALSVAVEEIARGCGGTGAIVSIHNSLYATVVSKHGSSEQKKLFLPNFVNGTAIGSFALSEPDSGSDAASLSTTADRVEGGWLLNGSKAWVTSAFEAKAVIVFAKNVSKSKNHKGITAFLVPIPSEGLSVGKREEKLGIRASSTCSITLNDVKVTETHVLGKEGEGFKIAMSSIDYARIGVASQAIGIGQAALDCAVEYADKRIAFGNSILKLQLVQQRIARMAIQLEAARLLTRKAALLCDNGKPFVQAASMAKLSASESATFASHNCIQILGGMGYVTDMPAERFYRDARITEIYGGPTDIHLQLIAGHVAKEYGFRTR